MINGRKLVVVMPADTAARTPQWAYDGPHEIVDEVILVDDSSPDELGVLATSLAFRLRAPGLRESRPSSEHGRRLERSWLDDRAERIPGG